MTLYADGYAIDIATVFTARKWKVWEAWQQKYGGLFRELSVGITPKI